MSNHNSFVHLLHYSISGRHDLYQIERGKDIVTTPTSAHVLTIRGARVAYGTRPLPY